MDWVREKMQQARVHRAEIKKSEQFSDSGQNQENSKQLTTDRSAQTDNSSQKFVWLVAGLASGAIIASVVWWTKLNDLGSVARLDRLQSKVSEQVQQRLEDKVEHPNNGSKPEQHRLAVNSGTASRLENLPPSTTVETNRIPLTSRDTTSASTEAGRDLKMKVPQPTVAAKVPLTEPNRGSGRWAINLVSLQQKVDAERFAKITHSKGVPTEINQVTVKGKKYWRVQVPGFSSSDDAKAKAVEIQEKLGLKDVWIVKSN